MAFGYAEAAGAGRRLAAHMQHSNAEIHFLATSRLWWGWATQIPSPPSHPHSVKWNSGLLSLSLGPGSGCSQKAPKRSALIGASERLLNRQYLVLCYFGRCIQRCQLFGGSLPNGSERIEDHGRKHIACQIARSRATGCHNKTLF